MSPDDPKNPATRPSALESAIAHLERSLCPDGSGHAGIPEGERAGFEWRALFRWAEREGLALPPQPLPVGQASRLTKPRRAVLSPRRRLSEPVAVAADSRGKAALFSAYRISAFQLFRFRPPIKPPSILRKAQIESKNQLRKYQLIQTSRVLLRISTRDKAKIKRVPSNELAATRTRRDSCQGHGLTQDRECGFHRGRLALLHPAERPIPKIHLRPTSLPLRVRSGGLPETQG